MTRISGQVALLCLEIRILCSINCLQNFSKFAFFLFIWKPCFFFSFFFSCNFTFSLINAQVYVKGIQIRKWKMDFSMKTLIIGCRNTSWSQWLSPRKFNKPIKSKFNESIVIRMYFCSLYWVSSYLHSFFIFEFEC